MNDVADAKIMKRLFELLFQNGVILVTTSNQMPEELYANGIQRPSFLPFIPFLRRHSQVVPVDTQQDFRLMLIDRERKLFSRLYYGKKLRKGPEKIFQTFFCLTSQEDLVLFRWGLGTRVLVTGLTVGTRFRCSSSGSPSRKTKSHTWAHAT